MSSVDSPVSTTFYEYYIECRGCGLRGGPSGPESTDWGRDLPAESGCYCIRIDRFGYTTRNICLVKDMEDMADTGLALATVVWYYGVPSNKLRWNPLEHGYHNVWLSGWSVSVTDVTASPTGFDSLDLCRFVPLKAFRRLKMIIRLLKLSRRGCVQDSPFRFCGGKEILRLSQSVTSFKGVASEDRRLVPPFRVILSVLFREAWRTSTTHVPRAAGVGTPRVPSSYHYCHLRM